jgi:hypothetical protein
MQPHEILAKKFYIPIKEEYEIVHFKDQKVNSYEKLCEAELKINESEYNHFRYELEKSGYSNLSSNNDSLYLEDWIDGKTVINLYEKTTVEPYLIIYADRTHMNIFITESIDGYHHVYMSRD